LFPYRDSRDRALLLGLFVRPFHRQLFAAGNQLPLQHLDLGFGYIERQNKAYRRFGISVDPEDRCCKTLGEIIDQSSCHNDVLKQFERPQGAMAKPVKSTVGALRWPD
jgi:hypothetical protein